MSVSLLQLVGLWAGGGHTMHVAMGTPAGVAAVDWMQLVRG